MVNHNCVVEGCNADARKLKKLAKYPWMDGVKFFTIPTDTLARNRWLRLIRREKGFTVQKCTRICSRHFLDGRPTQAHPDPELFPYNRWTSKVIRIDNVIDITDSEEKDEDEPSTDLPLAVYMDTLSISSETQTGATPQANNLKVSCPPVPDHEYGHKLLSDSQESTSFPRTREWATQTELTLDDIAFLENRGTTNTAFREELTNLAVKDDDAIRYMCGMPSLDIFKGLFNTIEPFAKVAKYYRGPSSCDVKSYEASGDSKPGPDRKLSKHDEFIMVLMWMRLGLPMGFVAALFHVTKSVVSVTVSTWVKLMHQVFVPTLLMWPTQEAVRSALPEAFCVPKFKNTRVIIDCTEFFIQRSKQPDAQYQTYSSYKSHNTLKVLVGITPNGMFSFVSDVWSGNVSDKFLTSKCDLIEKLEPGDEVMADRGFQIQDLLLELEAKLVIPPFTRKTEDGKKRLNCDEIIQTMEIAGVRIHVERSIGRMKIWRILQTIMPSSISDVVTELVQVIAGLCNLHKPLVK